MAQIFNLKHLEIAQLKSMENGTYKGLAAAHRNVGRDTSPYYKTLSHSRTGMNMRFNYPSSMS